MFTNARKHNLQIKNIPAVAHNDASGMYIKYGATVRNHVKLGVSLRVDTGYGLGRSLGDCRPVLPKGQQYQRVKTQIESQVRRPIV